MKRSTSFAIVPFGLVFVIVVGGGALGWGLGSLAGAAYRISFEILQGVKMMPETTGPDLARVGGILGLTSGLLAAAFYSWRLLAARRSAKSAELIGRGALWGVTAGVMASLLVHSGLVATVASSPSLPRITLLNPLAAMGIIGSILLGALMGALGGQALGPGRRSK
jgi:hypothetical protein